VQPNSWIYLPTINHGIVDKTLSSQH